MVECWWCGGEGLDEEGFDCLACHGTASVTWERICELDGTRHYPALALERFRAAVADFGRVTS